MQLAIQLLKILQKRVLKCLEDKVSSGSHSLKVHQIPFSGKDIACVDMWMVNSTGGRECATHGAGVGKIQGTS